MNQKILVIDDNRRELGKLREILTKEGFEIITATNRETAVTLKKNIKFEFILCRIDLLDPVNFL